MALTGIRIFEAEIVVVAEAMVDRAVVDAGDLALDVEIAADVEPINPDGGTIAASIESTHELTADLDLDG